MPLSRLLEANGALVVRFPALEIRACGERRAVSALLAPIDQFDLIVFVSANAVRFGAALLDQRQDLMLAAVGPATARALNQAGYRVGIVPAGGFDSESLLAHPRLLCIAGRRVLIVKGREGRELLEEELERRGATVVVAEVYERRRVLPDAAALDALLARFTTGSIDVITATSLEIGTSLLALATPALRAHFERVHWLVPSARVATGLRDQGLQAPLLQAASAEDQALLEELLRWRSAASGA